MYIPHLKIRVVDGTILISGQQRKKIARFRRQTKGALSRIWKNYNQFNKIVQGLDHNSYRYRIARQNFLNRHARLAHLLNKSGVIFPEPGNAKVSVRQGEVLLVGERRESTPQSLLSDNHPRWTEEWEGNTAI